MLEFEICMEIKLGAMRACLERLPDSWEGVLGDAMTDDDYRSGIRSAFAEVPGLKEGDVELVLKAFKDHLEVEAAVAEFVGDVVGAVLPAALWR